MDRIDLANGIEIDLIERDGEFLGLGEVRAGGVALRSAARPMFVDIRGADAVELFDYRLAERRKDGDTVVLAFTMSRRDGDLMDWMVHSVRNRRRLADWTRGPAPARGTRLELILRPVERTIGPRTYGGFSYQYRYASDAIPIYRLLDRGTWEPGGSAVGCEFWLRNCFVPPIARFHSRDESYATEWYLPGIVNPNIFQFLPLQTETQGFTFTAAEAGILLTAPTEVRHIRSMFEKPRGSELIVHWHEHCDDLAGELACSPVEVIFSPGASDPVERINAHEAARDHVSRSLHEQIGMKVERVTTYGMIEEWVRPDMPKYTDRGVPALLGAGVKMIGLASHFENNMNVYGVSNMCCTVDLKFAECVGADNMRRLCAKAEDGGAAVQMWANTSISTLSWLFAQRNDTPARIDFLPHEGSIMEALGAGDDAFVRNPSGAIESDHYAPVFAVLNLRDPAVRDYWLRRWKDAHDDVGLGGIFLDSSFNLSSDKFHFKAQARPARAGGATADQTHLLGKARPADEPPAAVLSQYRAHLDLMAEMQAIGYQYCNEDLGVFGTHRHGPGVAARLDSLFLWPECLAELDVEAVRDAGRDVDDVFFRGLAYRLVWMIYWDIGQEQLSFHCYNARGPGDVPTAWHLRVLGAFNAANEHMVRRRVLPGEAGAVYEGADGTRALWAFADLDLPLPVDCRVTDLLADEGDPAESTHEAATVLPARRRHVYLIAPRA